MAGAFPAIFMVETVAADARVTDLSSLPHIKVSCTTHGSRIESGRKIVIVTLFCAVQNMSESYHCEAQFAVFGRTFGTWIHDEFSDLALYVV